MKSGIGVARVLEMRKVIQRSGSQLVENSVDASGRRIRPAALRMEQKAGMVVRQVIDSNGDIVRVARNHGVGCNDVARVLVVAMKQAAAA